MSRARENGFQRATLGRLGPSSMVSVAPMPIALTVMHSVSAVVAFEARGRIGAGSKQCAAQREYR